MDYNLYTLYVKNFREAKGITQSELAFRIGKTQGYISQIESDNSIRSRSPQLIDIVAIANALDVCPNDLIRFKCNDCRRFDNCNRHENLEKDDIYFKEHFDFYI